jgi:hypothetical protein
MATPPHPSPVQAWVDATKPMLGLAKSKEPPKVPAFTPEDLARRKEQWKVSTLKPAQQQLDSKLAAASKAMMAKAQQKAGKADVGFVADQYTQLSRQFGEEALKTFPKTDAPKLVADFAARIEVVNKNLDALLADRGQFDQKLKERAAENEQWRKELRPLGPGK